MNLVKDLKDWSFFKLINRNKGQESQISYPDLLAQINKDATPDHDRLNNLGWVNSKHTLSPSKIAGSGKDGQTIEIDYEQINNLYQPEYFIKNGYYAYNATGIGDIVPDTNTYHISAIRTLQSDKIIISGIPNTASATGFIAFVKYWNSLGECLDIRSNTEALTHLYDDVYQITVNDNACFVGINIVSTDISTAKVKIYSITNLKNENKILQNVIQGGIYLFPFISNPITGNICVIGDSTIASYLGGTAISSILSATGTKTDISTPGDNISNQWTKWIALSSAVKLDMNYVFIQIGLNDLESTDPINDVLTRYQALLTAVKTDAPSAIIVCGTMNPCKQRLLDIYGEVNGLMSYNKWVELNYNIRYNTFTGIDKIATEHTYMLSDDNNNLGLKFDVGDKIHENNYGRKLIAYSWLISIQ